MLHRSILIIKHHAANVDDANSEALGMAEHILESFNDEDTIKPCIEALTTPCTSAGFVVLRESTLRALLAAADFAQDQKDYDAGTLSRDGDSDAANDHHQTAREWRKAWREARAQLRRLEPRKRSAVRPAELRASAAQV